MLVALVDIRVVPENRDTALHQLLAEVGKVRAIPGCVTFRPVADPDQPDLLTVLHEWDNGAGFDGYLASDSFARVGAQLRPVMTAPPSSRRYDAALIAPAG